MLMIFTILHIIVCVLLCTVVLMQSGKGGGLSGAFGGGGGMSSQMFGAKAMNTAMTKLTAYLAVAFFATSTVLFMMTRDRIPTTLDRAQRTTATVPANETETPAPAPTTQSEVPPPSTGDTGTSK